MTRKPAALVVATMDTKGEEALFVAGCLARRGVEPLVLDGGIRGESPAPVAFDRAAVAAAAGTTLAAVRAIPNEGEALAAMCRGAAALAAACHREGRIQGIFGLGGSMGTTLGTAVMRGFPVGFPKVMVSTMASRDTRAFVGTKDILMLHSVCDLIGLNRISRKVLRNGAHALAGMLAPEAAAPEAAQTAAPVLISTLGTTEACMQQVRAALGAQGFEVVVFHTVGSGGRAMEEIIAEEAVAAVVDLSLHEIADHLFGGDYDAGPERGLAALRRGVPTLFVPGNLDFLVTGPLEAAQRRFPGRPCHVHNAAITVCRTSREEMRRLAERVAAIAAEARGPVEAALPMGGFSAFDSPGSPLHDPEARAIFAARLEELRPPALAIARLPEHVNDPAFAAFIAGRLNRLWESGAPQP
jgi:uncharacterized protein (UPF0261 family)